MLRNIHELLLAHGPRPPYRQVEEQIHQGIKRFKGWKDAGKELLVNLLVGRSVRFVVLCSSPHLLQGMNAHAAAQIYARNGDEALVDEVMWDLNHPTNSTEQYAAVMCQMMGLDSAWFEAIRATTEDTITFMLQVCGVTLVSLCGSPCGAPPPPPFMPTCLPVSLLPPSQPELTSPSPDPPCPHRPLCMASCLGSQAALQRMLVRLPLWMRPSAGLTDMQACRLSDALWKLSGFKGGCTPRW